MTLEETAPHYQPPAAGGPRHGKPYNAVGGHLSDQDPSEEGFEGGTFTRTVAFAFCWLALANACPAQRAVEPESLRILLALEQATTEAIATAEESVVAIARVRRDQNPADRAQFDPLRIRNPVLFQSPLDNPDFVPKFFGSGVIVSQDGFVVTCAHVLGDPREHDYFVWQKEGSYEAEVVGRPAKVYASDPYSDLAVLKIDASDLTPVAFADPNLLRKGQFVIALGNPDATAMDGQASASWGIISNLNRAAPAEAAAEANVNKESVHEYGTLIQTDAKVGVGSSGGALVNLRGEMVGLTTSLVARAGFEDSAGFAIASDDMFHRVVDSLKLGKLPEFGFLGIQPENLDPDERRRGLEGARVNLVIPGLPGDQAGLQAGDLILRVNDQSIHNRNDLFRELSLAAASSDVRLLVRRERSGVSGPVQLNLTAHLAKKYVATSRPAYAIYSPPDWRGLTVEYATAVPSERTRSGLLAGRSQVVKVAVLSVQPDTPAWEAGLRPGHGIVSLDSQPIETPAEFRQAVRGKSGRVELEIIGNDGRRKRLFIADDLSLE